MKTTVKKLISTLLVFVMLLSAAPLGGFLAYELPEIPWAELFTPKAKAATSGTCGDNLTWTLNDEGTLTISGTGKMKDYSWSSSPWNNNTSIKKVIIQNGVTSIGDCAFEGCSSLTEITIPEGVTYIGSYAFAWCSLLTEIIIPGGVTFIGSSAFEGCSSLTEINIPEGVDSIGGAVFEDCISLTEITIPEGVSSIDSYAFYGCISLSEITIPKGMTYIDNMAFYKCSSLKKVNITDLEAWCKIRFSSSSNLLSYGAELYLNGEKVTKLTIPDTVTKINEYAFSGCSSLTEISIPKGVTSIGNSAFRDCSSLTEINIPEGVTSIGNYVFKGCSSLTEITIPEGVTSIGEDAFYGCSSLTEITLPEGVTSLGDYAFYGCNSLTEITLPEGVTSIGNYALDGCSSLTEINIPEGVTSIGDWAFYGCSSLSEITLPEGVTSIGDYAFDNCISLTEITIPDSVTSIGDYAFRDCISLTKIIIPESVTSIGSSAFEGCSSLTEINIPKGVFSIGNYAFRYCSSLTEITIPEGVTSISNYAFYGCSSLTGIIIPESVTSIGSSAFERCSSLTEITIPKGVTSIGSSAFEECSSINEITIPEGVTSIGNYAFYGCSLLTEITLSESVTSICNYAFSGCSSLTEITIPEGVTSIGNYAFSGCSSLTEITIPEGVTSIGNYAFQGCNSLIEIILPESVTSISSYAFNGCKLLTEITIPKGVISIGNYAFNACESLTNIYYSGTKSQWTLISIGSYNNYLTVATIYYNSTMSDKEPVSYPVTGNFGDNITWSLDDKGTLTISGSQSIPPSVNPKNVPWGLYKKLIKRVVVTDGVTSIGSNAFYGCSSLTEITLPEGVTSIGSCVFYGCRSLAEIALPEGVTSIGGAAFEGCSSLTEITLPEGVTSIDSSTFYGCSSLTEITIPKGVSSIGGTAFRGCSSITKITLPEGVTSIGDNAFHNCSLLAEITIPKSVTSIGVSAFDGCNSLKIVNITNLDSWCKIEYRYLLSNPLCKGAELYLNGEKVTKLVIPDTVTEIKDYEFAGCSSFTEIIIPEGVTSIGWNAFRGCSSVTKITMPEGVTSIDICAFEGCSSLTEIIIPESVTSIGSSAFEGCSSLIEIAIPEGVTSIGSSAFEGCSSLIEIAIPEGVTSIGSSSFEGCSSLTEITLPEGVTSIGNSAFYGCSSLTEITIPEGVTSIGNSAFYGCSSLTEITIPEGVTSIGSKAFYNCSSLTEITIPEGVTSIGNSAFKFCSSLTEITIPESVTSIGSDAFDDCSSLKKVNITDLEAWCKISFSGSTSNPLYYAPFLCINGVSTFTFAIPSTVTKINPYAFYNSYMISVYIPSSVTSIGNSAFYDCDYLTHVYYGGTKAQWNNISIGSSNDPLKNAIIHFAEADGSSEGDDGDDGYSFNSGKCGDNLFWKLTNDMTLKIWGSGAMYDYLSDSAAPWIQYRGLIGKIIIEYGATNIGDAAFRKCNVFNEIYIPKSVSDIGDSSFSGCNSLTDVYFGGTEEEWNEITIGTDNEPLYNATIHFSVPYDGSCECGPHCEMTATVIKEATCTENGETFYQCTMNSEHTSRNKNYPRALGHKLDNGTVTKEATCTAEGEILYKCTRDGCSFSDTDILPKNSHTVKVTKGYSSTCEGYGLTDKEECSVCGTVIAEAVVISPLGHKLNSRITTSPTCLATGIKTIYCTREDCTYARAEAVPALGHNPEREEVITASTCTETGILRKHCTNSGCTYYEDESTEALGHSTTRVTVKESTCLETGTDTITCSRDGCNYSASEETPALGHNPVAVPGFAVDCEADGLTDGLKCSRCDKVFTEQTIIPATGHRYDSGTVTKEPTCEETGIMTYTCLNNSSHTYTEDIPKAHVEEEIEAVEPSCDEVGYTSGTKCSVCGEILVDPEVIPATGHSWNSGYITTEPTCTENGVKTFTCNNNPLHTYTEAVPATGHKEKVIEGYAATCLKDGLTDGVGCENCIAIFTSQVVIPATGHSFDDGRVYLEPTCTDYGTMLYICLNDNSHTKIENIDKLPHTEIEVKGYAATCTESGLTDGVKCLVCKEFTTKQQTIDALGHDYRFDSVIRKKTCALEGIDKYVCQNDPSHIEEKETGTLPHDWDEGTVTTEATCTRLGEITYSCVVCPATYTKNIETKPHSYKEIQRVEPTCTEDGYYILSCETCSSELKYPIYSTGHYYGNDDICDKCGAKKPHEHTFKDSTVYATCASGGYTLRYCECGYSYKTNFTGTLNHSYDDGVTVSAAGCYKDGAIVFTCTVCGSKYLQIILAHHEWSEIIVEEATCTTDGLKYKECTVCGKKESEVIKAGHKWDEGTVSPEPTCTAPGKLTRKCKVCPATDITEIPALGHSFVNGVCERCGMDLTPKKDEYHPYYSLYFMVDDVYTIYGNKLVDEYGIRLEYNDDAKFRKVGIYVTQEGTRWKRVVACVGDDITSLYAVPYLSYEYEELYSPYTTELINLMPMTKNADGIWTYNDYALTDANLVDRNWNPILNIHNIGYSGDKTRVFYDLDEMIEWLKEDSDCIEHTEKTVKGYAATCTKTGLTDGVICSVCLLTLVEQEIIPLASHKDEVIKGKAPGCTQTGLTDGIKCSVCDMILKAQTVLPLVPHTEVKVNGFASTCTKPGLSDGTKCSVCGKILVAQTTLPLAEHTPKKVNEEAPQVGVPGYTGDIVCGVCGKLLEYGEEIPALDPSENCSHMCHEGHFLNFLWKILNFFNKLFKINPVCECGERHY